MFLLIGVQLLAMMLDHVVVGGQQEPACAARRIADRIVRRGPHAIHFQFVPVPFQQARPPQFRRHIGRRLYGGLVNSSAIFRNSRNVICSVYAMYDSPSSRSTWAKFQALLTICWVGLVMFFTTVGQFDTGRRSNPRRRWEFLRSWTGRSEDGRTDLCGEEAGFQQPSRAPN